MDAADKVLETMQKAGEPLNSGKIVELSGMGGSDRIFAMIV